MSRMPFCKIIEDPLQKGITILSALLVLWGCTAVRNEYPNVALEKLKVGETVYVCGCPMACCNSVSKNPDGRCGCNFPLQKGTVSRIQNGRVSVKLDGSRVKAFLITNR